MICRSSGSNPDLPDTFWAGGFSQASSPRRREYRSQSRPPQIPTRPDWVVSGRVHAPYVLTRLATQTLDLPKLWRNGSIRTPLPTFLPETFTLVQLDAAPFTDRVSGVPIFLSLKASASRSASTGNSDSKRSTHSTISTRTVAGPLRWATRFSAESPLDENPESFNWDLSSVSRTALKTLGSPILAEVWIR